MNRKVFYQVSAVLIIVLLGASSFLFTRSRVLGVRVAVTETARLTAVRLAAEIGDAALSPEVVADPDFQSRLVARFGKVVAEDRSVIHMQALFHFGKDGGVLITPESADQAAPARITELGARMVEAGDKDLLRPNPRLAVPVVDAERKPIGVLDMEFDFGPSLASIKVYWGAAAVVFIIGSAVVLLLTAAKIRGLED